jgi:hypothetical protein
MCVYIFRTRRGGPSTGARVDAADVCGARSARTPSECKLGQPKAYEEVSGELMGFHQCFLSA